MHGKLFNFWLLSFASAMNFRFRYFVCVLMMGICMVALVACGGGTESAGQSRFDQQKSSPTSQTVVPSMPAAGVQNPDEGASNQKIIPAYLEVSGPSSVVIGSDKNFISVTALNESRVALQGVAVNLRVSSGGILTPVEPASITDKAGKVFYDLSVGRDGLENNILTITATSDSVVGGLDIKLEGQIEQGIKVELSASSTVVQTGGDPVLITAVVKDGSNKVLKDRNVTFRATTGILTQVSEKSNDDGVATVVFSPGSDKRNRSVRVNAIVGDSEGFIDLSISGTKLFVSGPSFVTLDEASKSNVKFNATVTDSRGNAASGVEVEARNLKLENNFLRPLDQPSSDGGVIAKSDSNGVVVFEYSGESAGLDSLEFELVGDVASRRSLDLKVSDTTFKFITDFSEVGRAVVVDVPQEIQLQFVRDGSAVVGTGVTFFATRGTFSDSQAFMGESSEGRVFTDENGYAKIYFRSPYAGQFIISASAVANDENFRAQLAGTLIASSASGLVVQASPAAIAPNDGASSENRARLIAKVRDERGNPVSNKEVRFTIEEGLSLGRLDQASAVTDASGEATVFFIAGSESTASNGVRVSAAIADSAISNTVTLTVGGEALFVRLATGNVVGNLDMQTYKKDWNVYVSDATGKGVPNIEVIIAAVPTHYLRGSLHYVDPVWQYKPTGEVIYQICPNEDVNLNGILDVLNEDADGDEFLDDGEDVNRNGKLDIDEDKNDNKLLDPGNVVLLHPGKVITDSFGRASFSIIYGESFAPWVKLKLTASAAVVGTESRTEAEFILGGAAEDFVSETVAPAAVVSPFGRYEADQTKDGRCVDVF
jgi:hypothetical protein